MTDQSTPKPAASDRDLVRIVVQIEKNANPREIRDFLKEMDDPDDPLVWADEYTKSRWKKNMVRGGKWLISRVRPESFDELIYSAEVPRSMIPELMEKPWIARLDESPRRILRGEIDDREPEAEARINQEAPGRNWPLRPSNPAYRGKGATLVIIDSGIDIFHRAFQNEDGSTRLYAIYDQRGNRERNTIRSKGAREFGIDGLYLAADINKMIKAGRDKNRDLPFRQGFDHGTMVTSIAAGSEFAPTDMDDDVGRKFCGVAPDSNIIFICCHHGEYETGNVASLGYSMSHVMVLRTLARLAPRRGDDLRAMVINMSFGEHVGAHDGSTLLEAQIGEFTGDGRKAGVCVVKSAGNAGDLGGSTSVDIPPRGYADIPITVDSRKINHGELGFNTEWWFASCCALRVTVFDPQAKEVLSLDVQADGKGWVSAISEHKNEVLIRAMRYHNDNGDTSVLIRIHNGINDYHDGNWTIRLQRLDDGIQTAHVDAWIDLLDSRVATFAEATPGRTLTIPGTAEQIITVGAVENPAVPESVMKCSSRGPARSGAPKPELTATGSRVIAAQAGSELALREGFGTSFAAPQVSGAIALLYGKKLAEGKPLPNATQIRAALIHSSRGFNGEHDTGAGFGTLDIDRFLEEI